MERWKGGAVKLADESLRDAIRGKKIALMMNATSIHNDGRLLLDVIVEERWAEVAFVFGMEHGVRCNFASGEKDEEDVDEKTGIPILNLYNCEGRRPPVESLKDIDAVVYSTQDAGVRHWTFTPWLVYLMDSVAKAGCELIIVDRPNPIRGDIVEGNVGDPEFLGTLLCGFDYPLRHGMTVGELALMYNDERKLGINLNVLKMEGWRRDMWYDETGLLWIPPTPNVPNPMTFLYFCTTGLLQGSNVSFGRGSTTPFQFVGRPEFSSEELAEELNSRGLDDVYFVPKFNMAVSLEDLNTLIPCRGVLITVRDRDSFRAVRCQLHLFDAIDKLYSRDIVQFECSKVKYWARRRIASNDLYDTLERGESALTLLKKWEKQAADFDRRRQKYLLYK